MAAPTFTYYSKLPTELKGMIWEATFERRVICVKTEQFVSQSWSWDYFITKATIPTILHVSKECRALGLRYYSLAFDKTTNKSKGKKAARTADAIQVPAYVNWAYDIILPILIWKWDDRMVDYMLPTRTPVRVALSTHAIKWEYPKYSIEKIITQAKDIFVHDGIPCYLPEDYRKGCVDLEPMDLQTAVLNQQARQRRLRDDFLEAVRHVRNNSKLPRLRVPSLHLCWLTFDEATT